jgi:hypothetical protein
VTFAQKLELSILRLKILSILRISENLIAGPIADEATQGQAFIKDAANGWSRSS